MAKNFEFMGVTRSYSPPMAGEQNGGLAQYDGLKRRGQNMY